jgi:hypothetical protein
MKIIELVETREPIEEGPILNKLGSMAGNAVGTVAKGVGAVAGGVAGAWNAAKKGYQAGRATVGAAGDTAPAAGPAAGQGTTAAPAAAAAGQPSGQPAANTQPAPTQAGPTAGQGATAAPAAAGQGGNGGGAATQQPAANPAIASLKAQIDKLDPASKKQLLTTLQKGGQAAAPEAPAAAPEAPAAAPEAPAAEPARTPGASPAAGGTGFGFDGNTGLPFNSQEERDAGLAKQKADKAANPAAPDATAAPAAGTAPAPTGTTPPAGGKMTAAQQAALKAKLQGQRQAGKTTATQTGSGFNQYVQGGGGSTMAGADAQGNPVFKQNVQREGVEFYSKFLGQML